MQMVGGSSDEDGRINESSFLKLEGLGYDVGFRLVERYVFVYFN